MIDRDELLQEIMRREGEFMVDSHDYTAETVYEHRELDHGGIADFVIEILRLHNFIIEELP